MAAITSKTDGIKDYRTHPSEFVFNHLNEVEIRFYGNAAVAQGIWGWKKEGWDYRKVRLDGHLDRARRKWQIVAGEDLVPPVATCSTP